MINLISRLIIPVLFLFNFVGCAETSHISNFHNSLIKNENKELFFSDVVAALGKPQVYKEHENDITASWSLNFTGTSNEILHMEQVDHGEKLIIIFDKSSKKMLNWDYTKW
jgi:hypothetical protein